MNKHLTSHNTTLFLFVNGPDTNSAHLFFDILVNVLPSFIVCIQFSRYSYILVLRSKCRKWRNVQISKNFLNDAYAYYLWLYRQRSLILAILLNEMWKISCKIIVVALFVYDWGEFINISLGLLKNGNSIKNYQLDVRDTNLG